MPKADPKRVTRQTLKNLCRKVLAANSPRDIADILRRYARRMQKPAWRAALRKLALGFEQKELPFTVFTEGNSKLPFFSWSTLPEFTCPGAGECLEWCYSFTAWRYPAAFCRQLQNTLALRWSWGRKAIRQAWREIPAGSPIRLYVDGDIDSYETLLFWCGLLAQRQDLTAYGYSKSWRIFARFAKKGLQVPKNYLVNLSSGSRYETDNRLKSKMESFQFVRGQFVCVPLHEKHQKGFARFGSRDYHSEVRNTARDLYGTKRVFSCPGSCGDCLPNGEHACGSEKMSGVLIAIGEHN